MWLMRIVTVARLVGRNGLLLLFALRHPQTPRNLKLAILAMGVYLISPIDLLPEFLGLFGLADDAALLVVGIPFLMKRLPDGVRHDLQEKVDDFLRRFGLGSGSPNARSNDDAVDVESTPPRG